MKLVQHQSHVEAPARPRHSSASNFSETENYPGPNEAWLSTVQHGYSVTSDEKLLETSHGVGTGRPCVAPSPPRRDPTGEKSKERPNEKYSFPTSPSRSRQVNGVMSGAVRVRRIDRLSVDSRVSGSSVRLIYIIHE